MFKVQPVADELLAGGAFALGDFIFVMRKSQIDAAGVQVESLAQIFHGHGRALDMPTWPAASDAGVPGRFFGFVWGFPESEVARVFLLVLVCIDTFAAALEVASQVDLRKLAVLRERLDPVIDRTV